MYDHALVICQTFPTQDVSKRWLRDKIRDESHEYGEFKERDVRMIGHVLKSFGRTYTILTSRCLVDTRRSRFSGVLGRLAVAILACGACTIRTGCLCLICLFLITRTRTRTRGRGRVGFFRTCIGDNATMGQPSFLS